MSASVVNSLVLISVAVIVSSAAAAPLPHDTRTFPLPSTLQSISQSLIPSGPPVVLSTGTAFVAYYDYFSSPLTGALVAYDTRRTAPPPGHTGPPPTPSAGVSVYTVSGAMISD